MAGLTQQAGAHRVGVLAGAAQGLDAEGAALDLTYLELRVGALLGLGRLRAARHLLRVLRLRVLGYEAWVDVGDELGRRAVGAKVGHLVCDRRGGVGHVRVERLARLEAAVLLRRVVCSLVLRREVRGLARGAGRQRSTHRAGRDEVRPQYQPCGCHCRRGVLHTADERSEKRSWCRVAVVEV